MAVKLAVWNNALREIGSDKLSDTGETVERAYVLTDVWSDVVDDCLEAGQWNFATTTTERHGDTGLAYPDTGGIWGHTYGFAKPSDWVRTVRLSASPFGVPPLTDDQVRDEGAQWYSSITPLYASYVSNDTGHGLDLPSWPRSFTRFVELSLAGRIVRRLSNSEADKARIDNDLKMAKRSALTKDAQNEGIKFAPSGSWVTARRGGRSRSDRGNTGSLIG